MQDIPILKESLTVKFFTNFELARQQTTKENIRNIPMEGIYVYLSAIKAVEAPTKVTKDIVME